MSLGAHETGEKVVEPSVDPEIGPEPGSGGGDDKPVAANKKEMEPT